MCSIVVVHSDIQKVIENTKVANFGLWYNKFFPVSKKYYKPCDKEGKDKNAIVYYVRMYKEITGNDQLKKLLENKNVELYCLSEYYRTLGYKKIVVLATLKTPLVIGLGESHPAETSLLFNHNIGIPYIPASSIKGIIRFNYILELWRNSLLKEREGSVVDIPDKPDGSEVSGEVNAFIRNFGSTEYKGQAIFLDAFPLEIPDLVMDIINPNYGEYYKDESPPADYLSPNPINFMAVKPGSQFVFRVLIPDFKGDVSNQFEKFFVEVFRQALTVEGLGAKTALGYGRFDLEFGEPEKHLEWSRICGLDNDRLEGKDVDKQLSVNGFEKRKIDIENRINNLSKTDDMRPRIGEIWSELRDNKGNYSREIFVMFKDKLKELGEWEPKGNKKSKEKMKRRKEMIESILKEKENQNG